MASNTNNPVTLDSLITVKVQLNDGTRKFKIPLRDLGANVFPGKLRALLNISEKDEVAFDRFSDSASSWVRLDSTNTPVFKTLLRAAKAKGKLRIRATVNGQLPPPPEEPKIQKPQPEAPKPRPESIASTSTATLNNRRSCHSIANRQSMGSLRLSSAEMSKACKPTLAGEEGEAPLPRAFQMQHLDLAARLAALNRERELAHRAREPPVSMVPASWSVYCNNCDKPMANEHFHCSICDDGDYDLCNACVESGLHCPGEGHWLIKRFVKEGSVISSVTERIAPKPKAPKVQFHPMPSISKEMPGAFTDEKKHHEPEEEEEEEPTRTCNCCVKVFAEKEFVTCTNCEDYDLCLDCNARNKHGHHPGHILKPATSETKLGALAEFICQPGRNTRHNAICDKCDNYIYGTRHKCLICPDWDFCNKCFKDAKFTHPNHRFVPIYDPLPEPRHVSVRHFGIFCDGPLCKDQSRQTYIEGVRYKCAVCHDTDFCAKCEAIPSNRHNRTHPLIKFKTPVRNVSVTTMGEDRHGQPMATMGDNRQPEPTTTSVNASTQVQTVADLKPSVEPVSPPQQKSITIEDLLLAKPVKREIKVEDLINPEAVKAPFVKPDLPVHQSSVGVNELNAHFVRDTMIDGTKVAAGTLFTQVWTLTNPGPKPWTAGCSVRYVGGDNMLNLDDSRPLSAAEINEAAESNVFGREIGVGEEVSFSVLMKAPKREGTAISYWRLKAADGTPFGHRLWCHIDVIPAKPEELVVPKEASPQASPVPLHFQSDFELQLMLLNQQNKRRIALARAEQDEQERAQKLHEATRRQLLQRQQACVRAAALEKMRRETARIDERLCKVTKDMNSLQINNGSSSSTAPVTVSAPSVPVPAPAPVPVQAPVATPPVAPRRIALEDIVSSPAQSPAVAPVVEAKKPMVEEVKPQEEASQSSSSTMIFPKLDKESPATSIHSAGPSSSTHSHPPAPKAESVKSDDELDIFEDAESVEVFEDDGESDDEGFVTDEEYDFIGASDEDEV